MIISVDWMGFILASVALVLVPGPGSLFVAKTAATSRAQESRQGGRQGKGRGRGASYLAPPAQIRT